MRVDFSCTWALKSALFEFTEPINHVLHLRLCKGKSKEVPLQVWSGPKDSRKLRLPDFVATAQDGGKFVSLTHRPTLPAGNAPGTHFC